MATDLMKYGDVLEFLKKNKRVYHLLLENGFSMAYNPDIFSFNALHKFIDKIKDDLLSKLFGIVILSASEESGFYAPSSMGRTQRKKPPPSEKGGAHRSPIGT